MREIGWFILDPEYIEWPPLHLRNLTNQKLINRVHKLFKEALPQCNLSAELEAEFDNLFDTYADRLHQLRKDRNRILHSAFIELKAGGEVQGIMRSNPKLGVDEETGSPLFDREILSSESFQKEMKDMAEVAIFLNRAQKQLLQRYTNDSA